MSILITGMEMPKENAICVVIFPNGEVTSQFGVPHLGTAIPVPPHGRLVDADKMIWKLTPDEKAYPTEAARLDYDNGSLMIWDIRGFIRDQPTIIPADGAPLIKKEDTNAYK